MKKTAIITGAMPWDRICGGKEAGQWTDVR